VKYPQERWYEEGRILMEQGQTQAAAERLRDAVNFDPTYGHAWNGLGLYYYRQGRYDSALICWRIAAAVTPFYADRLRHLGMGYEAVGDSARAESCWLKAVELDSSDIASYMSLVKLYREQGRDEEYDAWLSRLAERPDVPLPVLVEYADHLAYAGDLRQAAEEFRRALERGLDTAFVRQRQDHYPGLEVIE
jgi:tetratricopeptide (TPR) repeat protein